MLRSIPAVLAFGLVCVFPSLAQEAPADGNAVRNGNFDRTYDAPNLWNGVNFDGILAAPTAYLPVLTGEGNIAPQQMPPGVGVADLNGDGKLDILSTDALGYVRVYFNRGSAQEPKFDVAELSLPFLATPEGEPPWMPPELSQDEDNEFGQWLDRWSQRRRGPRGSLADANGDGLPDLVVGNYFGEIQIFPNQGSANAPAFRQPQPFASAIVPTTKDPDRRWGNVFSPLMFDWDKNGLPDLLIGEGSYSANNIHLFLNQGGAGRPVFNEGKRQALALGGGREQLSPAVTDINGDGQTDILVADRGGRIAVNLNDGKWTFNAANPVAVPFAGFISREGGINPAPDRALVAGEGITSLAAGDLNGDGLPDLVVGRSDGQLAWARNEGSKAEPKFTSFNSLRGEAREPKVLRMPSQWDVTFGLGRGNFYAFASCVSTAEDPSAEPRSGSRVLKLGYLPSPNQIIPRPTATFPAARGFDLTSKDYGDDAIVRDSADSRTRGGPSNLFIARQPNLKLLIGRTYVLSFDVKGSGASSGQIVMGFRGFKRLGEDRVTRGARGAVAKDRNVISETVIESSKFNVSGNWATVTKEFRVAFPKERELNKEKETSEATLEISATLAPPDGVLYIDNVKLEPKP